jgi:hypothetical protein
VSEAIVGRKPLPCIAGSRAVSHLGTDEREIRHRTIEATPLEDGAILLDQAPQVGGLVRPAEPAPQDVIGARRDGGGRLDVDDGEGVDRLDDVSGALGRQELRADCEAACRLAAEPVDWIQN